MSSAIVCFDINCVDVGGLGLMTTAAAPAYDGQGLLIGVAGVDFLMK